MRNTGIENAGNTDNTGNTGRGFIRHSGRTDNAGFPFNKETTPPAGAEKYKYSEPAPGRGSPPDFEEDRPPAPTKRLRPGLFILIMLLLLTGTAAGSAAYILLPGFLPAERAAGTMLVIGNNNIGTNLAKPADGEIYLHVQPLQEYLDPRFFWDEDEKTAVITTADRVIHMHSEEVAAAVNLKPIELEFPLQEVEGDLFLPLLFLADFYGLSVNHHRETDTVTIDLTADDAREGRVTSRSVRLREGPGLRERTVAVLVRGDRLRVEEEKDDVERGAGVMPGMITEKAAAGAGSGKPVEAKSESDAEAEAKQRVPAKAVVTAEQRVPAETVIGAAQEMPATANTGWVQVRNAEGLAGYLPRNSFQITGAYRSDELQGGSIGEPEEEGAEEEEEADEEDTTRPATDETGRRLPELEQPIVLVWEFAYNNPDTDEIGDMPSLMVVSPTWFHLKDGEGTIQNLADPSYVRWAHGQGYHVWGLVSNSFEPEITAEMLTSSTGRRNVIVQLLALARLYNLNGLNIDFENFHYRYRDYFTQFIRELAPLCREEGLVLSVDVTFISTAAYWSLCYDRRALAEAADYVAVMAYDEHWGASPVAGSVSSLPWVERGLQAVLKEIPREKLLLGVPFYSRIWEIEEQDDGSKKVSSKAYGMEKIAEILAEHEAVAAWCEETGQNKAVYEDDGIIYKTWLEDAASMKLRVDLVNKYNLAGLAAWRRGFEKPEIWDIIDENLER